MVNEVLTWCYTSIAVRCKTPRDAIDKLDYKKGPTNLI